MNYLKLSEQQKEKLIPYYKIFRNLLIVSCMFSSLVSIIILTSVIQLKIHDPVNSHQMKELIEKVHRISDNENLKQIIRDYDLLIRKAYFTSLSFQKFGAWLLFGGICLFLISLKIMFELNRMKPEPEKIIQIQDSSGQIKVYQISLFVLFILLVLSSLISPYIVRNPLDAELKEATIEKRETTKSHNTQTFPSENELKKNWTGFRGFHGLGIAYVSNTPLDWNVKSGKNILWKQKIPKPGFSSPVVWEDKVFLSGADPQSREVYCFDANSGSMLWSQKTSHKPDISVPSVTEDTGLAAPTLAIDGRFVAAIFATGELMVLDFQGNPVWQKKLENPDNYYGHSSSLMIYHNNLIVQYDYDGNARLFAFHIETGEILWEKKRNVETSWTSPVLVSTSKGDQLILTATPRINAYDPLNGQLIWELNDVIGGEIGPSPAFFKDKLYPVNQYSILACIDIINRKIIWKYEDNLPDASSPVAYDNYLILPSSFGMVSCFNAETGKLYWEHKFKTGFYSSPVICISNEKSSFENDKIVYLMDKKGTMRIFYLKESFQSISNPEIEELSVSIPAFKDGKIFIRGQNHLYCIGKDKV